MSGFVATLGLGLLTLTSFSAEPRWSNDYGLCLRKAAAEGKPLLVVLATPRNAANSAQSARSAFQPASFRSPAPSQELLNHYVLCRVDVTTEYGRKVAQAFRATEFPHTVIIDRTGSKQIFKKTGGFSSDEWAHTLAAYRQGTMQPPRAAVPQPQPVVNQPAAMSQPVTQPAMQPFDAYFGGSSMMGFSPMMSSGGMCFT